VGSDTAAALGDLLDRYCEHASPQEKRAFYERHLKSLDVFPLAARTLDREVLAALSPAGRVQDIRCPVTIIHDRFDSVVPLREAERLYRELPELPGGQRHALVVTEVLSHVTPSRALDVVGLARLVGALEALVSEA